MKVSSLSFAPSGKYMLPFSSWEELLGTEKADPTDRRLCAEMCGGRNCLGRDFGVETNAASFVTLIFISLNSSGGWSIYN